MLLKGFANQTILPRQPPVAAPAPVEPRIDPDRAVALAQAGIAAASRGDLKTAESNFNQAVKLHPENAELHWLCGMCHWIKGDMDGAGVHLMDAVRINPRFGNAQAWLGEWFLNQGMITEAMDATGKSMKLASDRNNVLLSRAWVLEAAGELDGAWELIQQLLARGDRTPSLGRLYGRMAAYRKQEMPALEFIQRLLAGGGLPQNDEVGLNLMAAQLLEKLGRYDEAFAHAKRGNSVRPNRFSPEQNEKSFDRIIEYFTKERVRSLPRSTYHSDKPVFIVGMPRSGTSLVEQIVASHPHVHGAGELDFMSRICTGMLGMLKSPEVEYPACLDRLSFEQANGMAQIYLQPLLALAPDATRITDKMPLNFLHLGLINLLMPGARIIHCKRDPVDTCLSCHLTPFNGGNDFKYDLTHLGLFHRQYERLMGHWKQVLDIPILDVSYEELVADPEPQSRRLIDFLGLDWDPACLNFHETKRPVGTSSCQQVRQPMYGSSVKRWERYGHHLDPLKAALGM